MRITGGKWRSRVLVGPKAKSPVRPTPDALRERAFAVIQNEVWDADFLDLFAGTGSVGLEALSRGAKRVVFVEKHRPTTKLVLRNCSSLEVDAQTGRVLARTAVSAVRDLAARGEVFDVIWADPPFESWELGVEALETAASLAVVHRGGICCLECPDKADVPETLGELKKTRSLEGGSSRLVLFRVE